MTDERKPDLLGFLFGALESKEQAETEHQIDESSELGLQAGMLRRSLKRIALDCRPDHEIPPQGLAERTCQWVWDQTEPTKLSDANPSELQATSRSNIADIIVAACILLVAAAVFLPALETSRFNAGVVACQKRIKDAGNALLAYSDLQDNNRFPAIEVRDNNRTTAGIYAPTLLSNKLVNDSSTFFCPQSIRLQKVVDQSVPTLEEVDEAVGDTLDDLKSRMGGTYGYSLGYIDNNRYVPPKNHGREHFALLGDAPKRARSNRPNDEQRMTSNHGGRGMNLFFEDGHVKFFKQIPKNGPMDDPFVNQAGYVAAGVNWTDSVLGTSSDLPYTQDYIPDVIRVSLQNYKQ